MAAGRLVDEAGTSPDQTAKIKREQSLRNMRRGPSVGVATKPAADIAHDLKADIRIGIIAEIDAAEIPGRPDEPCSYPDTGDRRRSPNTLWSSCACVSLRRLVKPA